MTDQPEPSPEVLEAAAVTGAAHALIALATARAASIPLTPDSDGAETLWDHAPQPPHPAGSREEDAYMDSWYEVAHAALVAGETTLRYSFKSGRMVTE
jgi:hypothetical protein